MNIKDMENMEVIMFGIYDMFKSKHMKNTTLADGSYTFVDDLKLLSLMTPIPPYKMKSCIEIKESPIHGIGIFATDDIPISTAITFYPADMLMYYPDGNKKQDTHKKNVLVQCSERSKSIIMSKDLVMKEWDKISSYRFELDNYVTIAGHPKCIDDTKYLGHMINDRFKPNGDKITPDIYLQMSMARMNCYFYPWKSGLHVAIVTCRNISKGEELFISYGINYWKHNN
jgi:SET domain-containing protein